MRSDVEDSDDVRMVEDAGGAGFVLETPDALAIDRLEQRQDLDRDLPPEARIRRPVDFPHRTSADQVDDFVWAQLNALAEGRPLDEGGRLEQVGGFAREEDERADLGLDSLVAT